MLKLSQLQGKRVYLAREGQKPKRLGKLDAVVFAPNGKQVVGAMVRRPDAVGVIRRDDLFAGIDALSAGDKGIECVMGDDSFDDKARERLGIDDWDHCIIWSGMDVRTLSGKVLGRVVDVSFSESNGVVEAFHVIDGGVADKLIGNIAIPHSMLRAYDAGFMVVADEASSIKPSGGLAGMAGQTSARAAEGAKNLGRKASAKTADAVDKGSYQLGRALGKARRSLSDGASPRKAASSVAAEDKTAPSAPRKVVQKAQAGDNLKKSGASTGERAAKSLGKQIGKTKGMFEAFKREFEEGSK
ncbi:MAG: PRC-barrel domain-containing protein [Atopobiaceae bacterium]|nr:PRC-barrel domain-containing protein [Atopobiaceae bacterium]